MPLALFPSFLLFCTISAITPGPANLCSLASAMAYGRVPALRQWRGIFIGYALVSFLVSLVVWGLGLTFNRYIGALAWVSAAYILWLAWNILHSSHDEQLQHREHCNFYTGLFVQLTNAKIIVFCSSLRT